MNFLSNLWTFLQDAAQRPFMAPLAATVAVLLVMQIASRRVADWAEARGERWVQTLAGPSNTDSLKNSFAATVSASDQERARIEAQFQQLHARVQHHVDMMTYFYSRYYMAIVMMSLTGAAAAIMLFWIGRDGWSTAKPTAIIVFVILTTAALYYGTFPGMFKLEENTAENKRLYLEYVALQNEVRSYCVTGEDLNGEKQPATKFIHYLDSRMEKLNNIAVGFDPTKVSTYEELKKLDQGGR